MGSDGGLHIAITNHFSFLRFISKGMAWIPKGIFGHSNSREGNDDLTKTRIPPLL